MQNSDDIDDIYNKTNFNLLENKLQELIKIIKNLKERNKDLQGRINKSDTQESLKITNTKKRKIKEKIENIIEELESVL